MSQTPILHALSAALGASDAAPDAELLRRFAEADDRAAFELVVRRHAELVWGACRAALPHDAHAAEDAFQATFLALARKAGSLRDTSAAGWLFRVARNAAVRARSAKRETAPLPEALAAGGPSADEEALRREAAPVVAEEVDRLAAKFREPVLLCFFEGHSHAEAATKLGWPVGTVASRLARAKDLLRDRLTRRGVVLPAAGLVAVFAPVPVTALPVPGAVALATGPAERVPQSVLSLTQGVLSAMRYSRLKSLAAVLAAAAVGVSVALAGLPAREPPPPERPPESPAEAPKKAADAKPTAAERLKALQGKWRVVSDAMSAEVVAADPFRILDVERLSRVLVTVENDRMINEDGNDGEPLTLEIRFPKDGPADAIDLVTVGGPKELIGVNTPAIYKLDGDRLTLCIRDMEHLKKGRPTEFKADDTQVLEVLERVRDEKAELKALAGEWTGRKFVVTDEEILPDKTAAPKWTFDGADVRMTGTGEPGEKATVKLDPNPTPPTIDLTVTRDGKQIRLVGRYSRQDNRLTVCVRDPQAADADRPKALVPDADVLYYVFERSPKK